MYLASLRLAAEMAVALLESTVQGARVCCEEDTTEDVELTLNSRYSKRTDTAPELRDSWKDK
jgi:hypothetical protein